MSRWVWFLLVIVVGFSIGLVYGWFVSPVQYVDTAPASLREDYRTDYILMVAEAYHADKNLALAVRRLALLGGDPPQEIVRQASLAATKLGYTQADLDLMQALRRDLLTWNPALEAPSP